ncbi:DUF4846 domain-containing protein [Chitinophaga arvensicola]|uniref:DUF4846 domain-containing protein n=1 Tax=Chitinophaga arvensicola TaxID=29529 RepID=A0A1I0SB01_9BACT|nr:DUF4846 domain-containing protein [Chitinophaga arvensicola]SEW52593.1 protein of unknown function (4846) [Chitinophaga arvensicola]
MITIRNVLLMGMLTGATAFVYASQLEGWEIAEKPRSLTLVEAMLPALWYTAGSGTVLSPATAPEVRIPAPVTAQESIAELPLPAGFKRLPQEAGSFGAWLRTIHLKTDNKVYLYNGQLKNNQQAQYAVLDISIGNKDLQQCADAVMRLYAEYLYASKQFSKIAFHATDGTLMDYASWMKGDRFVLRKNRLVKIRQAAASSGEESFHRYLETVFVWAGTLSLSKELVPVKDTRKILPGDVFIRGGAPGHAVIVMDVAENNAGERVFLLAQSYMPAQNIHVLKNPASSTPWYPAAFTGKLLTPEWVFDAGELARFP